MSEGLNAKGKKIGYYRNRFYAELKNSMNPKPGKGYVDLKLTGAFYEAVTVDIGAKEIEFTSLDGKTNDLEEKYGSDIFGLNEIFHNEFIEKFEPVLVEAIKEKAGL